MKVIKTQAIITSLSSHVDRSLGLRVNTPELTSEEKTAFMDLQGLNLEVLFNPLDMKAPAEMKVAGDLQDRKPSVRLRNVLYIWWNQTKPEQDFDSWYKEKMEKIIDSVKAKLEPNY